MSADEGNAGKRPLKVSGLMRDNARADVVDMQTALENALASSVGRCV